MEKELKKRAKIIFDRHPKTKVLFINPRGEFFTRKDLAQNSLKNDEDFEEINRQSVKDIKESPVKEMSINELTKHLEAVKELPVVEEMLIEEQSGQNRKGAISVLEEKIEDLKNQKDES